MNYFYNIHNIFSVNIYDAPARVGQYIVRELEYFTSNESLKADLKIIFTDKLIIPESAVSLLKDMYYKDGILYFIYADANVALLVRGWPGGAMEITSEKTVSAYTIFSFIEKILFIKLLDRDYCFVHAACCRDRNKGRTILFIGLPGSGKTSWILNKCKEGALFLSDDLTILNGKGKTLAYPRAFTLGEYHKDFFGLYIRKMSFDKRLRYALIKYGLLFFAKIASLSPKLNTRVERYLRSKNLLRVRIKDVVPGLNIVNEAVLDEVVLAVRCEGIFKDNSDWGTERVANFLIYNTNRELFKFIDLYFMAFLAYGDKHAIKIGEYIFAMLLKQKKIISSAIANCTIKACDDDS